MKYEKPQVEVVKFDNGSFIATSGSYADATDYLNSLMQSGIVSGWSSGNTNQPFTCPSFSDCNPYTITTASGSVTFRPKNKKWGIVK